MSLVTMIQNGFTATSTAIRSLRSQVTGSATGNLTGLTTTAKTSLIAAINELDAAIDALGTAASINDASAASTTQTYSITKIKELIATAKQEILGNAAAAYDTLEELKAYADSGAAADLTALAKRVRVDAAQ